MAVAVPGIARHADRSHRWLEPVAAVIARLREDQSFTPIWDERLLFSQGSEGDTE